MLPVQCEDCVYANWDYTLFRDNCAGYDYVNKRIIPPYREQFDFYCNKHKRFYLEEEITGTCRDGVYGPNNYSEICKQYYLERAEYIESLKKKEYIESLKKKKKQ